MARTSNGNLTGKAAQTAQRELREEIQESYDRFLKNFDQLTQTLQYLLGEDFESWWDSYPETMKKNDFFPIMEKKVDDLLCVFSDNYKSCLQQREARILLAMTKQKFTPEQTEELNQELEELEKLIENI